MPLSTSRRLALLTFLTAACATTAQPQSVRLPPAPRPAGTACEERLQKVQAIATPSVHRDTLLRAVAELAECRPEIGRGFAALMRAARATTDSTFMLVAFLGGRIYRDSAIVRAAVEIAGDRSASERARVLGFAALYDAVTTMEAGYRPSWRELTSAPLTADRCIGGFATDASEPVELTPRSPELVRFVGDVAKAVQADPNESRALRSAATCVLGEWRAATGMR